MTPQEKELDTEGISTVDTIEDLRAMEPSSSQAVLLLGYHEPFDGGGGTFVGAPTSTVEPDGGIVLLPEARSNSTKGRWRRVVPDEVLNLLWFGARRDDTVDAAPAIQSALSALRRFNGSEDHASRQHPEAGYHGTLYIPRGTYRIGQSVSVDIGGIRVVGDGAHSTVLRADDGLDPSEAVLEVKGSDYGTEPGPVRRTYFSDFMIRGRGTEPKDEPVGIRATQMNYWMFERLDLHYLNSGMRLRASFVGQLQNVCVLETFRGSILNNVTHNVHIEACRFINTLGTGEAGLRIRGCAGFSIESTNFARSDVGLRMDSGIKGASISGCYFEKNKSTDIELAGQSLDVEERKERVVEGLSITGNLFNSSKRHSIYVRGKDEHPVSGLHIAGNYVDGGTKYLVFFDGDGRYRKESFSISGNSLDTPEPAQLTNFSGYEERMYGWQKTNLQEASGEERLQKSSNGLGVNPQIVRTEEVADVLKALIQRLKEEGIL